MIYKVESRYQQMMLGITVQVSRPTKVRLKVVDADKPNTVFTSRYKTISQNFKFSLKFNAF
jgi:hypothetical protein